MNIKRIISLILAVAIAVSFTSIASSDSDCEHTLTYNLNGGTVAATNPFDTTPIELECGDEHTILSSAGTTAPAVAGTGNRAGTNGVAFESWNTKADGTGASYKIGDKITIEDDVTLFAQWTPSIEAQLWWLTDAMRGKGEFTFDFEIADGTKGRITAKDGEANIYIRGTDGSYTLNNSHSVMADFVEHFKFLTRTQHTHTGIGGVTKFRADNPGNDTVNGNHVPNQTVPTWFGTGLGTSMTGTVATTWRLENFPMLTEAELAAANNSDTAADDNRYATGLVPAANLALHDGERDSMIDGITSMLFYYNSAATAGGDNAMRGVFHNGKFMKIDNLMNTFQGGAPVAPTITTTTLPDGEVGVEYSFTLEADGSAPIEWTVVPECDECPDCDGGFPLGLTLSKNGTISGTPVVATTFTFKIKAENVAGSTISEEFTVVVKPAAGSTAPNITTASLPNGTVKKAYNRTLAADGDDPISWSIDSGKLPDGLKLSAETGAITGTPTKAGKFTFTVKAENDVGSTTKEFTITIAAEGTTAPTYKLGRIISKPNQDAKIGDALEILKFLAGMDGAIKKGGPDSTAWKASLITSASQRTPAKGPSINDALEILKYLANMNSAVPK